VPARVERAGRMRIPERAKPPKGGAGRGGWRKNATRIGRLIPQRFPAGSSRRGWCGGDAQSVRSVHDEGRERNEGAAERMLVNATRASQSCSSRTSLLSASSIQQPQGLNGGR